MNGQELMIKMDELLDLTRHAFETFATQTEAAIRGERPMLLAVDEDNIDETNFKMDATLVAAAPVAAVPRYSAFFPLQESGHRFLLAEDGMHIEVRRPWVHFIHRIAEQRAVKIPYGALESRMDMTFGRIGNALPQMREFAALAKAAAPNEAAASLIWNDQTNTWSIKTPEIIGEPTPVRIQYREVELDPGEHVVIDLHSHGHGPAGFSSTDNEDDAGAVKIAGVFGNLDQPLPTVAFRLCVLGLYIPISVPVEKIFG